MRNTSRAGLGLVALALGFALARGDDSSAAASSAAAGPTEEVVKGHVRKGQERLTKSATGPKSVTVTFESVRFGAARKANERDEFDGVPKGGDVYPVRVKYTVVYHWADRDEEKKIHYNYNFYRDGFGEWAALGLGPVRE